MRDSYVKVYSVCKNCKGNKYVNGNKCDRCMGTGEILEKIPVMDLVKRINVENVQIAEEKDKLKKEKVDKFYDFYVERNKKYSKK